MVLSDKPLSCSQVSKASKRKEKVLHVCLTKAENRRLNKYVGISVGWRGSGKKKIVKPIGD